MVPADSPQLLVGFGTSGIRRPDFEPPLHTPEVPKKSWLSKCGLTVLRLGLQSLDLRGVDTSGDDFGVPFDGDIRWEDFSIKRLVLNSIQLSKSVTLLSPAPWLETPGLFIMALNSQSCTSGNQPPNRVFLSVLMRAVAACTYSHGYKPFSRTRGFRNQGLVTGTYA